VLAAVVENGQIFVSSDSGATWTASESNRNWRSITISSTGSVLIAVAQGGQIYISSDNGSSWNTTESARDWEDVTTSANGTVIVAAVANGQIYTSSDSGATFTARDSVRNWTSVASSSDGVKLFSAVSGGQLYTSTDSGATWTARESSRNWVEVSSSADGVRLVAVEQGGQVYSSPDSGVSWTSSGSSLGYQGIASSSDGSKIVAVAQNGQIFTGLSPTFQLPPSSTPTSSPSNTPTPTPSVTPSISWSPSPGSSPSYQPWARTINANGAGLSPTGYQLTKYFCDRALYFCIAVWPDSHAWCETWSQTTPGVRTNSFQPPLPYSELFSSWLVVATTELSSNWDGLIFSVQGSVRGTTSPSSGRRTTGSTVYSSITSNNWQQFDVAMTSANAFNMALTDDNANIRYSNNSGASAFTIPIGGSGRKMRAIDMNPNGTSHYCR
jgi:hypothetical protein